MIRGVRDDISVFVQGHDDKSLELFAATTLEGLLDAMVEVLLHIAVRWRQMCLAQMYIRCHCRLSTPLQMEDHISMLGNRSQPRFSLGCGMGMTPSPS